MRAPHAHTHAHSTHTGTLAIQNIIILKNVNRLEERLETDEETGEDLLEGLHFFNKVIKMRLHLATVTTCQSSTQAQLPNLRQSSMRGMQEPSIHSRCESC